MLYSEKVKGLVNFDLQVLDDMYGDVISKNGLKQLRIAETEKYAHVTYFFDGGIDKEIEGATRILVNSPKVATYDMKPEMSAYEVTEKVLDAIKSEEFDTIILNFANCDMVGHTAVFDAAVKAVETVDECMGKVYEAVQEVNGTLIITADHGNADVIIKEDGSIWSAHTSNPVPFCVTREDVVLHETGALGDITPTMLDLLGITQPAAMTGKSMIKAYKK
jgi:2,3-bisphosphoglycerate-independent phosphoglycerate mutase